MAKDPAIILAARRVPAEVLYHPLKYLGSIKASDTRKQINGVMDMPYPADPMVEPEFQGLTYMQVALIRQAENAARQGSLASLEFFTDRMVGRPAQINVQVNATESYEAFLQKIAEEEEKTIEVSPEWKLE